MSEYIEVGQPLQFTDPNTPTRVGEIVENVSDIFNIPSPRLGMQVFVKSEKKSFVITSLKSKVIGGVDVPEAAAETFEPVGAKSITWNNDTDQSNMNDFVVAGVYDIKGERKRTDDNLPILNTGGGHSFNARLTVLDSSISGSGKDDDKCITQVLSFSNRLGQGEVYIRTGKGSSLDSLAWEKWSTLQRNVNVGEVGSLDDLKDNGIYSGVWLFGSLNNYPLTFVCVVINDYFIGTAPRRVSQFVYGLSKFDGSVVYQSRVWDDSKDKWGDWEILNQKEISSMIKSSVDNAIKGVIADAPEAFDTLKEIADWIANDETGAVALANAISANTKAINTEVTRAKEAEKTIDDKLNDEIERSVAADQDLQRGIDEETRRATEAEQDIKDKTVEADSLNFQARTNVVALDYKTIEGVGDEITIPAATTESAGVMSAEDKKALDNVLGLESRVDFNDSVVGSSNTFFDLSEPIKVVKGDKLKFKVELTATNNNTLIAYLWSSNTYITAGYDVSANFTEIIFTISADATITRISLRGDTILNGSISTVIVEGVTAKINKNAEEIQQIESTGYASTIVEGSYLSNVGYATSDAGYKCTDFIPVIEGATLSVTGRKVCAYNENKQFVSVLSNSGGDIIIPSQVRYIRVDAAKTSVLDITRDGSPLLGVALLQDVCNANNSFKNIYSKYTLSSGYYAAGSGIAQANSAYVKTDHIRVSGNVYFNIRCLRACFYDADKKFLSSVESAKEHVVVPENAVYVTFSYPKTDVEGKNLVIYGDRINEFIVYKDEFETAIKQLREEVTDAYVTQYTNNLTNEQDSTVTVVSGEYGAVGAKYSLPVKCTGKYSLHFEFKYPANVDGSRKEILRFDNIAGSVKGGCRVYLDNLGYTIAEQQIRSGRVVALAPITSDNNYVARIGTSTSYASLQTGNDAFSLRYLGSDQTATMSITENGLLFRGVAEVNDIPFPANASMLDFANTLKTMCSEGGSLNGVFDFAAYDVFGRSTADLTKVANIPLYYTYSYGVDNFPVFVPYNDDNWHSVDIVFDSSATKGWDLLSFFFDGHIVNYVDNGFTLTGNGVFNTNVTIGGDGIAVRNLKYTDRCTKIDAPLISIEMLHGIKDELSLGGQDRISVSEIERVITVYKKHGYKHIPLSEISQYIRGNKALSGKYFCLVHDDYFYSSPKLLNLYKGMDCKVCFAIINELLLDEVADEYKKNSSQFEYAIHSETSYASLKYDSLVQKIRNDMANLGNKLNSITNMLVYPYGATNRGIGKVLFHEGVAVALIVGDNRVSMYCNPMILPRMPSRATGAFENLDSSLANVDKYYKE